MSWLEGVRWQRAVAALVTLSVAAVIAYALMARQSETRENAHDYASEFADADTTGIEPIVTADGLTAIGFGPRTLRRVDPQIRSLNASLVRLAAAHRAYHLAHSAAERDGIQARARPLHIAVDRSEDALHELLTPDELERFHTFLWPRIAAAGLPREEQHHAQGGVRSGVVRGIDHSVDEDE